MGKESVWQRRARKIKLGKADYYPKVDLADEAGADALARIEALEAREPAPEADRFEQDAAQGDAIAEGDQPIAVEAVETLAFAEPAPIEAEAPAAEEIAMAEPAAAASLVGADAVRLPEFLDLAAAAPLARILLDHRGQPIVIDGSAVHQLGAQCVQVLLSARRTWNADGVPLSIVNCAPRMVEDLQFLGIDAATLISGDLAQ